MMDRAAKQGRSLNGVKQFQHATVLCGLSQLIGDAKKSIARVTDLDLRDSEAIYSKRTSLHVARPRV
jgi:hypothetical protein